MMPRVEKNHFYFYIYSRFFFFIDREMDKDYQGGIAFFFLGQRSLVTVYLII